MSQLDDRFDQETRTDEEVGGRALGRDLLGLVLFAFATLLGVSVFMSVSRPVEQPTGSTALFTDLVGLAGAWPLIVLAISLALLGGRIWVAGVTQNAGRSVLGVVGVSLALAVLAGALLPEAGGWLGEAVGGRISRGLTPFVGVPFGLLLIALVVWAAWLRVPAASLVAGLVSRAPAGPDSADSEGLTPDEALALLPDPELSESSQNSETAASVEKVAITGRSIAIAPDLKPLYPPDVRRLGGIPEGTRPLESRDQAQPTLPALPVRPPSVARRPEPVDEPVAGPLVDPAEPEPLQRTPEPLEEGPERPADQDLAARPPGWELARGDLIQATPVPPAPLEEAPPLAAAAKPLDTPASPLTPVWEAAPSWEGASPASATPTGPREVDASAEPGDGLPSVPVQAERALADDEPAALPPEAETHSAVEPPDQGAAVAARPTRPGWEQPGLFDEEPVDAYGTPVSLVDALRLANEDAVQRLSVDAAESEGELDEELEDEEELEEEEEAEEELEEELEEAYAEDEDEELEEGEEEEEAEEELEEAYAEDEDEELEEGDAEALAEGEEDREEEEPEEDDAEEALPAVAETPPAPADEPEVVLQPRPATAKPKRGASAGTAAAPASVSGPDAEEEPLYRAGLLFLQRGRVAVSLLQRDFGLDFKQATALLDELQEAGLIGPYLGGQRRDILLSAEEWRERRVGAS